MKKSRRSFLGMSGLSLAGLAAFLTPQEALAFFGRRRRVAPCPPAPCLCQGGYPTNPTTPVYPTTSLPVPGNGVFCTWGYKQSTIGNVRIDLYRDAATTAAGGTLVLSLAATANLLVSDPARWAFLITGAPTSPVNLFLTVTGTISSSGTDASPYTVPNFQCVF